MIPVIITSPAPSPSQVPSRVVVVVVSELDGVGVVVGVARQCIPVQVDRNTVVVTVFSSVSVDTLVTVTTMVLMMVMISSGWSSEAVSFGDVVVMGWGIGTR